MVKEKTCACTIWVIYTFLVLEHCSIGCNKYCTAPERNYRTIYMKNCNSTTSWTHTIRLWISLWAIFELVTAVMQIPATDVPFYERRRGHIHLAEVSCKHNTWLVCCSIVTYWQVWSELQIKCPSECCKWCVIAWKTFPSTKHLHHDSMGQNTN